jgi:hypothetical protein
LTNHPFCCIIREKQGKVVIMFMDFYFNLGFYLVTVSMVISLGFKYIRAIVKG